MVCPLPQTDYSNYTYGGELQLFKTLDVVDYVKIVVIGLIMFGTIIGNISVIAVIVLTKTMRSITNMYVANLAVADLLVCAVCMTAFLLKILATPHVYPLGATMCKVSNFGKMTFMTASVMTLSAIACDRSFAILFPLRNRITKHRPWVTMLLIWLACFAICTPVLFIRKLYTITFANFVQPSCGENWPATYDEKTQTCVVSKLYPRLYYTSVSVILFFLPVTIMAITYCLILSKLSGQIPGDSNQENLTVLRESKKKVIKMMFTVLVVFTLCWMPLNILLLYDKYSKGGPYPWWTLHLGYALEFMAYTNSFFNPIIYGAFNKRFRDNLLVLLGWKRLKRRFTSLRIIERFRTSLTTAITRTRTTGTTGNCKESANVGAANAPPGQIDGTVPQRQPENNLHLKEINQLDGTPV